MQAQRRGGKKQIQKSKSTVKRLEIQLMSEEQTKGLQEIGGNPGQLCLGTNTKAPGFQMMLIAV
jgi:hypothetical protein